MPIIAKESVLYNWLGYLDARLTDAIDDTSDSGLESVIGLLDVLAGDTPPESGNTPPVAVDDTDVFSVEQGSSVTINATQLLANDSDADADDHLTIVAVSDPDPSDGTAVLSADGTFITFSAAADYSGPASFGYVVYDGEDTATASVTGIVTEGGGGGVGETETVAITGAGSTIADDAVVETFDITIGDYAHTIEDFDPDNDLLDFGGDALDLTAADLSIVNTADDGMAVLSYTPDAGDTIVEITLTGLSSAEDLALTSSAGVDSILA
jgi:hypothetical protein